MMNPSNQLPKNNSHKLNQLLSKQSHRLYSGELQQHSQNYLQPLSIQENAKQSLLDIEQNQLSHIPNPQRHFMKITKNLKFNSLPKNIDFQTFSFMNNPQQNQHNKILIKTKTLKNKLKKQKQQDSNSKSTFLIPKTELHSQRLSQLKERKTIDSLPYVKPQRIIFRNESNLLTPRSSLPAIYQSQKKYIGMKKRNKSSMKPYSFEKMSKNIRVLSVIRFKQDLSMLPLIKKQLKKSKLFLGYD